MKRSMNGWCTGVFAAAVLSTAALGPLAVGGFYLEKTGGHNHVAVLEE